MKISLISLAKSGAQQARAGRTRTTAFSAATPLSKDTVVFQSKMAPWRVRYAGVLAFVGLGGWAYMAKFAYKDLWLDDETGEVRRMSHGARGARRAVPTPRWLINSPLSPLPLSQISQISSCNSPNCRSGADMPSPVFLV